MEVIDSTSTFSKEIKLDSIKGRAKFATISLMATVIFSVINGWQTYVFLGELPEGVSFQKYAVLKSLNASLSIVEQLTMVSAFLAVISICMWFYSANKNLHKADLFNLEFTPGWAVGWFFVPFANFYYPFAVMREIYKGSVSLDPQNRSQWQSAETSPLVLGWWLLYLLPGIFAVISMNFTLDLQEMIDGLIEGRTKLLIGPLFSVISGSLLLILISKITALQEKWTA